MFMVELDSSDELKTYGRRFSSVRRQTRILIASW